MYRRLFSILVALILTTTTYAGRDLTVGSPAPGLDIEKWVNGSETSIESGKVYVIEFWATWCKPCRKSIPHLTELQNEFADKGLVIIGISDEDPSTVERFVKSQGNKMSYTVAVDRRKSTNRAWMQAADRKGIPSAFIVNRSGNVVFIGHPLDAEFDTTLKRVMSGRYDPELERKASPVLQAARQARQVRNWRLAIKSYDEVIALDPGVFAQVALEKFEMLLIDMDDRESAYKYARTTIVPQLFASDADALHMLASKVALDPKISESKRDLDLALEAAESARKILGSGDPEALAAVAMVRFHRGEIDEAIDLQKRAYFSASPKHKAEYRRTLTSYQRASQQTSSMLRRRPS